MGVIDNYLKSKEKKKYYCLNCFQYTKKRYFLQVFEDESGKVYKCPHCKHMWIDWALEKDFEQHERELLEKMGIVK